MAKKLGIFDFKESDKSLIIEFLEILEINNIDFTNGFRSLALVLRGKIDFYLQDSQSVNWFDRWLKRLKNQKLDLERIAEKMDKINPILIPRNHIIKRIIDQCVVDNNFDELKQFLQLIESPFKNKENCEQYYLPPKKGEEIANTFCGT